MIKASYKCTQQELYTAARLGWNNATAYLTQFTAFKPKYIATLITGRLADIDAAEALPDSDQRSEDSRTLRINLKSKATEGLDLWQKLKRYIVEAYGQDQQPIKLNAAGQGYYRKAAQDDWNAVKSLLNDGSSFITANVADLTANDNMPSVFAASFTTVKTEFEGLLQDFFSAGQNDEIETQTKIQSNNDVYQKLISMFLDGQKIFRNNEAVKKLFTFEQVLLTVSGPGVAGIRGLIKDERTNQPIGASITVSLLNTDYSTTTNVNSRYTLSPVAANVYTVVFEMGGYQTLQIPNVEIQTGVIKTLNASFAVPMSQIVGTVTDINTHAPVNGAILSDTANVYTATSGADGAFTLNIPIGTYGIAITKAGYLNMQESDVEVIANHSTTLNVQMTPAS